jgi:type I restriction-modification system DNA methylase subunit
VVCDPPVNVPDWGCEDLLLDAHWEFGAPTWAEGELAWLQHCYAHVASGGRATFVASASAAYRKADRRIRLREAPPAPDSS